VRQDGVWKPTSWATYVAESRAAARALVALGFEPGHNVCILGFNRPEWTIVDHGAMLAGGAPAGIYTTCSPSEVQYIVEHAEARIVVVENAAQFAKIAAERERLPGVRHVVLMRGASVDDPLALTWEEFLARGQSVPESAIDARLAGLRDDRVATLVYTSGTTGPPKAVMLTHRNLAWTAGNAATRLADLTDRDSSLSYLPLSHIAEQMFSVHGPATAGYSIYFAESFERVGENLREVQPTIVFGVPRVWEKMHARVAARLAEAPWHRAKLADWAMSVGRRASAALNAGRPLGLRLSARHLLAERLFFRRVKLLLGLSRVRFAVTGAAPIATEVLEFFAGLDVRIHEIYGQSEDCGPTSFNAPGRTRFGSVGPPVPDTEVRIAQDGEILIRGPHVFAGYLKDPAATAEALQDGWLHSGDLGRIDEDGFLYVTGRKKDILITAGGKNVAPRNLELALAGLPLVLQAVAIGDRRPYISALVTLDPEALAAFYEVVGDPSPEPWRDPRVIAEIQRGIDATVNPRFARVESIRTFTVLSRELSIESGELTPSLKIKRAVVNQKYSSEIEGLYSGDAARLPQSRPAGDS
jgi:long-chain acyl-CoA synthetase